MVMDSNNQLRMVVKHTFLELVEEDKLGAQNARQRASSEPRKLRMHSVEFDKCDSVASTRANDTEDEAELMLSDDEEQMAPVRAPPGVWAQAQQAQTFVPVCVAFVPIVQQPVWKKSSRSARRRRARAMNRWFRLNMQSTEEGEQHDELDAEFDDEWQLPSDEAEFPEMDADSWPTTNSPSAVQQDKKKA